MREFLKLEILRYIYIASVNKTGLPESIQRQQPLNILPAHTKYFSFQNKNPNSFFLNSHSFYSYNSNTWKIDDPLLLGLIIMFYNTKMSDYVC